MANATLVKLPDGTYIEPATRLSIRAIAKLTHEAATVFFPLAAKLSVIYPDEGKRLVAIMTDLTEYGNHLLARMAAPGGTSKCVCGDSEYAHTMHKGDHLDGCLLCACEFFRESPRGDSHPQ